MKLFFAYLRSKWKVFLLLPMFLAVFFMTFALYRLPLKAVYYPAALCVLLTGVLAVVDFLRVKRQHDTLQQMKKVTAAMAEHLPESDDILIRDYQELIAQFRQNMVQQQQEDSTRYRDMVDYYTVWAHQIKTPIAAMHLALQAEDTPLQRRLSSDLRRIERYVEMVLAFLRLDSESSDYVFRSHSLDDMIRRSVRKSAPEFIDRKLRLSYEGVEETMVTDDKWFAFVMEQLLSNALKYTPQGGEIRIYLEQPKTLCIADTGIGIAPEDLPRIFEKGYTGYNGRTDQNASGIGLYLCRRICDNLGVAISVASEVGKGTTVRLNLSQYALKAE